MNLNDSFQPQVPLYPARKHKQRQEELLFIVEPDHGVPYTFLPNERELDPTWSCLLAVEAESVRGTGQEPVALQPSAKLKTVSVSSLTPRQSSQGRRGRMLAKKPGLRRVWE